MALARLGDAKGAMEAMEECLRQTPAGSDQLLYREKREEWFAQVCVVTGDYEKALERISDLLRKPSFLSAWKLRMDPVYDPLRKDPRFQALIAKDGEDGQLNTDCRQSNPGGLLETERNLRRGWHPKGRFGQRPALKHTRRTYGIKDKISGRESQAPSSLPS